MRASHVLAAGAVASAVLVLGCASPPRRAGRPDAVTPPSAGADAETPAPAAEADAPPAAPAARPVPAPEWLGASTRGEVLVNDGWESAATKDAALAVPAEGWKAAAVPGVQWGDGLGGSGFTWYRRRVRVPAEWKGRRVFLRVGGARYHPHVFAEGKLLAERLDGWTPFEVEITRDAAPGGECDVAVRCQDWSATFIEGYTLPEKVQGDLRDFPVGKVRAPVGGHFGFYGLWDDVALVSRPMDFVDDVAIETSVRKGTIAVRGGGSADVAGLTVEGVVLQDRSRRERRAALPAQPGDVCVLRLPPARVGADGRWELSAPFPGARFWSPEGPHLYRAKVALLDREGGKVLDVHDERFGFRELWTDGPDFVLNGIRRHLLATSGWPHAAGDSREDVRRTLEVMKAGNNVAFRLHTQPWQRKWVEIADEVGMMIVEEGALWCDRTYRYDDPAFWENCFDMLAGMIRRDRNRASLVMWSVENELLHCGSGRFGPHVEKGLGELGRRMRELDPAHLITYEADIDPDGAADVIGLHYPHEMPDHADYPNTADWLDKATRVGTAGGLMGSWGREYAWDRSKPLYIGEYLWVPARDYSPGTVFFGDEAYRDRWTYGLRAKALAWEHQTIAYRRAGVSGLCPWTYFEGGGGGDPEKNVLYVAERKVYEPVAAFPRELDSRFFAGEKVDRAFDVFNDSTETKRLRLRWKLGDATGETDEIALPPAGREVVKFAVRMPDAAPGDGEGLEFSVALLAGGTEVHRTSRRFSTRTRALLGVPAERRLLVFDPRGGLMAKAGDPDHEPLESLDRLAGAVPERDILLIGPGALGGPKPDADVPVVGQESEGSKALRRFLVRGGGVLCLEQESLRALGLGAGLVDHTSTMAFSVAPGHPVLDGISADDLKFWRGDHYVSRREVRRPETHGSKALVVSGGAESLDQAPIVEMPVGRGTLILCQALVGEKLGKEPVADRIFRNAVAYLASLKPREGRTLVLAEGDGAEEFVAALEALGVEFERPDGPPGPAELARASLLALHGGGPTIESSAHVIEKLGRGGLRVYWHSPDPATFERVKAALGAEGMAVIPSRGPLAMKDRGGVFSGVCAEDFTYAGARSGPSWMRGFDPDPTVVDRALAPVVTDEGGARHEVERMELAGTYVRATEDGKAVVFATNGTATGRASVPRAGLYPVRVLAGGSQAQGGWPQCELRVNGTTVASVVLDGPAMKPYATMADLPAGEFDLAVAFVNDLFAEGEDRNLTVDAVVISREPLDTRATRMLTLPPAVVAFEREGGGVAVIDCVRWEVKGENARRGRRYASALLSNLGASFAPPPVEPSWVGPKAFEPVGTIPHFGKTDRELSIVAAGTVRAEFECATEGEYAAFVRGRSSPAKGVFAKTLVTVDDQDVGEPEIVSRTGGVFPAGTVRLAAGRHALTVRFTNDLCEDGEDRNLYLQGVGFTRRD